jgi:hypothetical protein
VVSSLLLLAGAGFYSAGGQYNPILMAECLWFWGYTIDGAAGLALANNMKLVALNFFNPFVFVFKVPDYEASNLAVMRMGVDANFIRIAGGVIFFSAVILIVVGVLAIFLSLFRETFKQIVLFVLRLVLLPLFFFTLLWLSFIPSNPKPKGAYWSSLAGILFYLLLQTL